MHELIMLALELTLYSKGHMSYLKDLLEKKLPLPELTESTEDLPGNKGVKSRVH